MSENSLKRYNVLFLMNGIKPPRGGEYLTLNLLLNVRKDRFHPILAYAREGVIVEKIKKAGIDSIQIPVNRKITNIYLREEKLYDPFFILPMVWYFLSDSGIFKVKKIVKENNIHLIYCADNLSKFVGGIAGKMAKIKVAAHCHDDFQEDLLGKFMRVFYLALLDRIFAVSDKVRTFFKIRGEISEKVITVYNGIDKNIFNSENVEGDLKRELGINEKAVVIGSIGVIEKDKGHRYLFEAVEKLKHTGINDLICIVCGTGPEEVNLKKFVSDRKLSNNVYFAGRRNDIPKIMKSLDMLVITSLTIESFSMVAAEAMAMKVPVIATKTGGLPEVVEDGKTGILVPPGDVEALSGAIEYLIKNPEKRSEMGKNGRLRVIEKFSVEKNVSETEKIFLDLIEGNN